MKRETRGWLEMHARSTSGYERERGADALATDAEVKRLRKALKVAYGAMNHLGDELNERDYDAGESEHYEEICAAFEAVRAALKPRKAKRQYPSKAVEAARRSLQKRYRPERKRHG